MTCINCSARGTQLAKSQHALLEAHRVIARLERQERLANEVALQWSARETERLREKVREAKG